MKYKIFLVSILLVVACKQVKKEELPASEKTIEKVEKKEIVIKEPLKKVTNNMLISMKKMPCAGECIAYNITVSNNGKVNFIGIENVLIEGSKEFTLTKVQQEKLTTLLSKTPFEKYENNFIDDSMVDYPSTFIKRENKQLEIKLWKNVPNDLIAVHEYLEEILLKNKLIE